MVNNIYNVISLQYFTVFPEYFIALSIVYILIVITLITYNSYGLMLQKAISECISLILFMTCYLIINDDLIATSYFYSFSFNYSITNDYLAFFTRFLIAFFSSIYFLLIADSLKEQKLTSFEYLIILLFAVLGLMLMCCSNDLIIAYLSIELSSLAFYVLASFKKTSSYSVEGGIKYFITGAVSSAFFLLGSSFLYGILGTINFFHFYELVTSKTLIYFPSIMFNPFYLEVSTNFVELGLLLIYFSLYIKLALAPFHLWSLDVYEGSPTSTTIFFAVITKLSVFAVLIRLFHCFYPIKDCWYTFSICIGLLSIFVGAFGGLKQRKLKTLFAYSSITHMGYLLLSISIGRPETFQMFFFYIIIYMISGLCMWFILLFLRLKQKTNSLKYNKELGDLALLKKSNSTLAFSLALTMFSIAGIPPLIGFIAKLNVFFTLISYTLVLTPLLGVLFSVVSTFYYIRIIKVLYFENLIVGKLYYPITSEKTIVLSILVFSLIFLFINPNLLYIIIYKIYFFLPDSTVQQEMVLPENLLMLF